MIDEGHQASSAVFFGHASWRAPALAQLLSTLYTQGALSFFSLFFHSITLLVLLFPEGSSTIGFGRRYIVNIMSYPYSPLSQILSLLY